MSVLEIHNADRLVIRQEDITGDLQIILTEGHDGEAVTFAVHVSPLGKQDTSGPLSVGKALEFLGFEFYDECRLARPVCYSLTLAHLEHGKLLEEHQMDLRKKQFDLIVRTLPSLVRSLVDIARQWHECGLEFRCGT
jgi:hypothetical protein